MWQTQSLPARTGPLNKLSLLLSEKYNSATTAEDRGLYGEALVLLNDIIRADRTHSDSWKLRGQVLTGLERHDLALENYREAAKLFPKLRTFRIMQARVHVLARRWDKAVATYHAMLRDNPLHLNSIRELMDIENITPDSDICRALHAAQDDLSMKPYDRASTWFLQGQIYMNNGRDDEAFAFYIEGNRQMQAVHDHRRLEYSFSTLLPELDAAFQRRYAPVAAPAPCPLLVVSGLPRSGKSLMETLLASQASLLAGGETSAIYNAFLDVDRSNGADAVAKHFQAMPVTPIRSFFLDRLRGSPKKSATRVIDTTPGNLEQLGLLGPLHPDVPIIFVRRDPRDLAASLYFKQFNKAHRYTYDLGTAARAIARTEFLARKWQATMPNPMIEVRYEDLVADPVGCATRILTAFGIAVDQPALQRAATDDGKALNLTPGRSLDGVGAIRGDLIGFSERFARHLEPVLPAYEAEVKLLG